MSHEESRHPNTYDEETHEEKLKHNGIAKKKTFRKRATRLDRQENRSDRIMSRQSSGEETQPPGAFPSQEDDQDDEEETLGALRVPGMDSTDRDGDEEDGLTATDLRHERSAAESTSMTVEAQLVEENEREQHEEELRQQFLGELGQVGQQAEVVEEDNGSKTRRRALLYSGIVVVLSVSITTSQHL
jgi:hypothetical protein